MKRRPWNLLVHPLGEFTAVLILLLGIFLVSPGGAEPLVSPTWGFRFDPPEGYAYSGGDNKNRFSFASDQGGLLDLVVYEPGRYDSVEALASDVIKRLHSTSETSPYTYHGKKAALFTLRFTNTAGTFSGWGLAVELGAPPDQKRPLLVMLAYGPEDLAGLDQFNLSAIDSLSPSDEDRLSPGPVAVFSYPPTKRVSVDLPGLGARATIDAEDKQAAKATVDREFAVLTYYTASPLWKEAWTRFYRAIYRDSYDRLSDVAFETERSLTMKAQGTEAYTQKGPYQRTLAESLLSWIQGFTYERNLMGSDFIDLVTAATEGRGDCDSRALLFATLLQHSDISAAIMVSRDYGHAMALVQVDGAGARFDWGNKKWVVAETTAKVPLGLIAKDVSDPNKWLGILLP
jgi:hypothetical protein